MPSPLLRSLSLLVALIAVAGCGVERESEQPPVGTGAAEQQIIGGTLDSGDMAVVQLAVYGGSSFATFCTGTLIAPQTVLTAAHCVYSYGVPSASNPVVYYAHFGSDGYNPQFTREIVSQTRHPQYTGQGQYDIAVLKLISPVTNVTPIPINTTTLTTAHIGQNIRHVGFGVSSFVNGQPQSDGKKRQVTTPLRQVTQLLLESGASSPTRQTCSGDSGGPGFMVLPGETTERVVGVVAFGDQYCQQDGWDTKVDAFDDWVKTTYDAWETPQCTEDGRCASGCATPDIDCVCAADSQCTAACPVLSKDPDCPRDCGGGNGCSMFRCPVPDPDCTPVGQSCSAAGECQGRQCVGDAQHATLYCSRACTVPTECPQDMTCTSGACRFIQQPILMHRAKLEGVAAGGAGCSAAPGGAMLLMLLGSLPWLRRRVV